MMYMTALLVMLTLQVKPAQIWFSTHMWPSCFIHDSVNSKKHDIFKSNSSLFHIVITSCDKIILYISDKQQNNLRLNCEFKIHATMITELKSWISKRGCKSLDIRQSCHLLIHILLKPTQTNNKRLWPHPSILNLCLHPLDIPLHSNCLGTQFMLIRLHLIQPFLSLPCLCILWNSTQCLLN